MMGKLFKRSFKAYAAWDYEKEERDLNNKSQEGWQLVKGGCFNSLFKQDQAVYRYKLDFNPRFIAQSNEKQNYIGFFEEQGWEHINTTFNGWHFFRKPYVEGSSDSEYEIYTDNTSYAEMLNRWIKIIRVVQILGVAVIIAFLLRMMSGDFGAASVVVVYAALITLLGRGGTKMKAKLEK